MIRMEANKDRRLCALGKGLILRREVPLEGALWQFDKVGIAARLED